ncbi:V-type proton ATPase subunit H isoform X1 [Bemisia tabaci]|uniref:V-type proton ATPase subunit H isoform X1 n=1 Tax=Bemisia tabaci TaxID=7038 RepID=UPI0008F9952E|nr:PREDICTED: V-type proton ATPase subunit H isoform X1 [Bemisia tabaci]
MAKSVSMKEMLPSLPDEKIDMLAATSVLQQQATEIRNQRPNWQPYLQSQMISQDDFDFINAYDNADSAGRSKILAENRTQAAKTFPSLLEHVSKDQTIQYILVLIDDMLQEDRSRVEIFAEYCAKKREPVCGQFLNLLNGSDGFIVNMSARIIAKIACWNPSANLLDSSDLHFYLNWLNEQLKLNGEYMQSVGRCLQVVLRHDEYRLAFIKVEGPSTLLKVLASRQVNFQIQYQLIFCLWLLTFNPKFAQKMNKLGVIPILADILSDSVKEKVTRIILAVFRNLIEKPEEPNIAKEHCIAMVQSKVLKQLSILEQRKFDDEDIVEDVQFLNEKLQASVQDLSSFDEYATEVKCGRLEWSPVHRSAQFWRENAARLNERNYELLRCLVHLLDTSKDALVLSVASFDVGEYVRHYPRGKHVIEQLGGKQLVMQLLSHEDPNVRYEALLAVQKLMVHNWEYLGRQLEKEQGSTTTTAKSAAGVLAGKIS